MEENSILECIPSIVPNESNEGFNRPIYLIEF